MPTIFVSDSDKQNHANKPIVMVRKAKHGEATAKNHIFQKKKTKHKSMQATLDALQQTNPQANSLGDCIFKQNLNQNREVDCSSACSKTSKTKYFSKKKKKKKKKKKTFCLFVFVAFEIRQRTLDVFLICFLFRLFLFFFFL